MNTTRTEDNQLTSFPLPRCVTVCEAYKEKLSLYVQDFYSLSISVHLIASVKKKFSLFILD